MDEFDTWFKRRHTKTGLYERVLLCEDDALYTKHEMRKAYLSGRLKAQRESSSDTLELQERIDKALSFLYDEKGKAECDGYSKEVSDFIFGFGYELKQLLKGDVK